jgi:hemerythrin superfamily protein
MADNSKERVRAQSYDFVKMMVEKASKKEEPASPEPIKVDNAEIEKLVKNLQDRKTPVKRSIWEKKIKP